MLTGMQIRAARGALRWSAETLSLRSGVGVRTIKRMEGFDWIPNCRPALLLAVMLTFEGFGIEFFGINELKPGLRLAI